MSILGGASQSTGTWTRTTFHVEFRRSAATGSIWTLIFDYFKVPRKVRGLRIAACGHPNKAFEDQNNFKMSKIKWLHSIETRRLASGAKFFGELFPYRLQCRGEIIDELEEKQLKWN